MKAFIAGRLVNVVLSRRNLNELLAALDAPPSRVPLLRKAQADGTILYIGAEEDAVHYQEVPPEKSVVHIKESD